MDEQGTWVIELPKSGYELRGVGGPDVVHETFQRHARESLAEETCPWCRISLRTADFFGTSVAYCDACERYWQEIDGAIAWSVVGADDRATTGLGWSGIVGYDWNPRRQYLKYAPNVPS